jgi:hypothetical protein
MEQNLLFFPIKLFGDEWSLFVIGALPCIGKKSSIKPMMCYLDPIGNDDNNADIITVSVKIRNFSMFCGKINSDPRLIKLKIRSARDLFL